MPGAPQHACIVFPAEGLEVAKGGDGFMKSRLTSTIDHLEEITKSLERSSIFIALQIVSNNQHLGYHR